MVDADRLHPPVAQQPGEQPVRRVEDFAIFDPQAGQRVDVEEPPVVDLVRCRPPIRQAVGLLLEQIVQRVEAPRIAGRPVRGANGIGDLTGDDG
jgi:hypothetical protein